MIYDRSRGLLLQRNDITVLCTGFFLMYVSVLLLYRVSLAPTEKLQQFLWLNERNCIMRLNWMNNIDESETTDKDKEKTKLKLITYCDFMKAWVFCYCFYAIHIKWLHQCQKKYLYLLILSHFYHLDASGCDDKSNYICCENMVE